MKCGDIVLVKTIKDTLTFILILKSKKDGSLIGCQMRKSNEMDLTIHKQSIIATTKQLGKRAENKNTRKKYRSNSEDEPDNISYSIYVEKIEGMKYDSIVMSNKIRTLDASSVIKIVGHLGDKELYKVLEGYEEYIKIQELHKELHELKKKIAICQFNNKDYKVYQNRLGEVVRELKFPPKSQRCKHEPRPGIIAPKGYIKIYLGGRG